MNSSVTLPVPPEVQVSLETLANQFGLTPEIVLQRILKLDAPTPTSKSARSSEKTRQKDGFLKGLVDAGHIAIGDSLTFHRPRAGQTFTATVEDRGWIELADGRGFPSPSAAAEACVGGSQSGWECWKHGKSGKLLFDLREELNKLNK